MGDDTDEQQQKQADDTDTDNFLIGSVVNDIGWLNRGNVPIGQLIARTGDELFFPEQFNAGNTIVFIHDTDDFLIIIRVFDIL